MKLTVLRLFDDGDSTIGALFIDGVFECFTLEDEYRRVKVKGETRIPAGEYKITLRTEGGFHSRYVAKYGSEFHKGMLWVRDVPGFEYILIHTGNTDEHTAGCLLVGNTAEKRGFTGDSGGAYVKLYPKVRDELIKGNEVKIHYVDIDRNFDVILT